MIEQVRPCAVWPTENWLESSLNQIQGWTTVRESYSRASEQGTLLCRPTHLCEYGEGLSRRPLAHPELREDVLELFVVDYVVA